MARVALIGPELEENLALRYLHAALSKAGHESKIFDFHARGQIDSLAAAIQSFGPELVGLSMVFTARAREYIDLAETLKFRLGYTGHITAGGHFASFHAEQLLTSYQFLDTIIHGEGEQALVELAGRIDCPADVDNVSYRNSTGSVCRTEQRPNQPDLDALAWPTRTPPMHTYLNLPITNMIGGRGCFGNCSFCSIAAWHRENGGPRFRFRSPGDIASEMAYLYHDCGVRIFNFHDDNFFCPREQESIDRFVKLRRHLKKERVGTIAVQIKARPDSISQPIVSVLKELGLFRVFLGVENNAVAGLKALGRGITRTCNHTALHLLQKHNIHTTFNLLMFEPEMSSSDLLDNIAILTEHPSFPLNFGRVEVYSGTPLEQRLRKEDRLIGTYFGYTYAIKDQRMQSAFEIFRKVFTGRNFDTEGMNHLSMRLDYYYHLLHHFYPHLVTSELTHITKESIANLNRNSATLLRSIHDFVTSDRWNDQQEVERTGNELLVWRQKYDSAAQEDFLTIIRTIENTIAESQIPKKSIIPGLTASAAAAILVVASMNCDNPLGRDWHVSEMIANPLDSADWANTEMIPQYQAEIIRSRIYSYYDETLRSLAYQYGFADKPISVDLMVSTNGSVIASRVSVPDSTNADLFSNELTLLFSGALFEGVDKQGRCSINLTVVTLPYPPSSIKLDTNSTHICEMIAMPADSSPAEPVNVSLVQIVWNDSLWNRYRTFDSSTVQALCQHVDSTYLNSFSAAVRKHAHGQVMHIDMILDAFGNVTMFRIRSENGEISPAMDKQLRDLVMYWRFPFIKTMEARSGKCSIPLTIISVGEPHVSEMIPFPVTPLPTE